MAQKILCVAEKPAIAKSVANHLAGGTVNVVSIIAIETFPGNKLKNGTEKHRWQSICKKLRI